MIGRSLLAVALACLGSCSTPSFWATPRVWRSDVSGHVGANASGAAVEVNSIEDALGLDHDSAAPGLRFDADFGAPRITFAWQRSDHSGLGMLDVEISDDDVTLPAGTDVATDVGLDLYSLLVTFDLVPTDTVEFGIGLGLQGMDVQAGVRARDGMPPGTVTVDEFAALPVLAARAGVELGPVELSALLSGFSASYEGDSATLYDLDVAARLRLLEQGRLSGSLVLGWREVRIDAEYEDGNERADLDVRLSGPYFGLVLGF